MANACAVSRSSGAATPVTRSTRSGHHAATASRTASKHVVRRSTYAASTRPSATSTCSSPFASARSLPGGRLQVHVGQRRGRRTPRVDDDDDDTAAALPQRRHVLHQRRHGLRGVRPTSRSRSVSRTSASGTAGHGRGRRPSCRRRPPTTCRTGRCSRRSGCRARRGRTCRAGSTSRWSAHRRRAARQRPHHAAPVPRAGRLRSGPAPRPTRRGAADLWTCPSPGGRAAAPGWRAGPPLTTPCRRAARGSWASRGC